MLRVKSFKISDDVGINALLSEYRLAPGAHILVSEGVVCIPYEDGEPENNEQAISRIKEEKNTMLKSLGVLTHSQLVNDLQIADVKDDLNIAQANHDQNRSNKALQEMVAVIKNRKTELENQYMLNKSEITRLQRNIDMYDVQIKELSA